MINLIFDIDGTLVVSYGFDSQLYIQAVGEVVGDVYIHEDWGAYIDVTDLGILSQILRENNVEASDRAFSAVRSRFSQLMQNHLSKFPCIAKPGAIECVANALEEPNYTCGIATGGWGVTAKMKLESAGIDISGMPLFSCDQHLTRIGIMQRCNNHLNGGSDVVYIGDGEWDRVASDKLNWGFVGIGERLSGVAEVWISDFNDPNWTMAPNKALERTRLRRWIERNES